VQAALSLPLLNVSGAVSSASTPAKPAVAPQPSLQAAAASAKLPASPQSSLDLAEQLENQQAYDVTDMSVVLDDDEAGSSDPTCGKDPAAAPAATAGDAMAI